MKHIDDIQELLERTAMPNLASGSHRQRLKQQLFDVKQGKEKRMPAHRIVFASHRVKIAAACIAALLLVAGAWGAQHVMKRFVFDFPEEPVTKTLTAPDGTERHLSTGGTFRITTDDPDFTEADAREQHEGIKKAIDNGAAELIEIKETELGTSAYIYKATLDNGQEVTWASGRKLYDPNEAELTAEFEQAIVEGRGEVVKTVEAENGEVYIYKVILSDGSARTYSSGRPPAE